MHPAWPSHCDVEVNGDAAPRPRTSGNKQTDGTHVYYRSLVRPHLEYCAPVWDPHLQRDIQMLERTQKFAYRMCTKTWNAGYEELRYCTLHNMYNFSLSNRRLFLKLCTIFKVIHGMCYFPPHVIFTRSTRTNFSRSFMLTQPFPI